jgi:hypothetical protein
MDLIFSPIMQKHCKKQENMFFVSSEDEAPSHHEMIVASSSSFVAVESPPQEETKRTITERKEKRDGSLETAYSSGNPAPLIVPFESKLAVPKVRIVYFIALQKLYLLILNRQKFHFSVLNYR